MTKKIIFLFLLLGCGYSLITFNSGCAQIGVPTGGPKDTIPPVLTKASPENFKLNFTGNKITLSFNEYIELKDLSTNILFSPVPKTNPTVGYNLKTITVKLRDTLQPNTTYSINFGNAIVDIHEGNIMKDFTYTFSTGSVIDSMKFSGKLVLAETGKADSTIAVYLYKDAVDTSVTSRKPNYIARTDGQGNFTFKNLPAARFRIYALKDGDGGKTYNSKTEFFAFNDEEINTAEKVNNVYLFAYAEEKPVGNNSQRITIGGQPKKEAEKKLRFTSSLSNNQQDLLLPFSVSFGAALKTFDSTKIILADTNYRPYKNIVAVLDTSRKKVIMNVNWQPETSYIAIVQQEVAEDSLGNKLDKTDTLRFTTKKESDYGRLVLRFKNLDFTKHPVVQFLQTDVLKFSFPITSDEWKNTRFVPGEYDVRVLYDINNNGNWDPGNYKEKLQPERAIPLPQKIAIKADWDNERDIQL